MAEIRTWSILEQTVEDKICNLIIKFYILPSGEFKMTIFGDMPFGNRDFVFDKSGNLSGTGTSVSCQQVPTIQKDQIDQITEVVSHCCNGNIIESVKYIIIKGGRQ